MSFGEHTSKEIIGSRTKEIEDKKIILCITGSVAAIKSTEIARELMRRGADIYAVMTESARQIIHPDMVEWATGNPVVTELTGKIEHVTYAGEHKERADLILVAPSTANTIGKIAAGIDDTTVTTTLTTGIGAGIPVIIAPAMHSSMYNHPIVNENIEKLKNIGIDFLMPRMEEGKAKIPSTTEIVDAVVKKLSFDRGLEGKKILITAGPTRAYIDAFRYITNPSSGKMGISIAEIAKKLGADVTLVYGPGTITPPQNLKTIRVETTEDMLEAVTFELREKEYNSIILSAAASDYGLSERILQKTPSGRDEWVLKLKPLPKIIEKVKEIRPNIFLIGFKAEYDISDEELINRAYARLKDVDMDLIVANDVSRTGAGFGTDTNEVFIIDSRKNVKYYNTTKKEIAEKILNYII
ncbi:bifunctional phosphopantothenoylcysteine decarboxylase/phosphopantothenate--cysteine ligase CoaBC [Candidatus Bathyarchaeota archaeon]|nr:bifunctional phosphopantothenoylcysteine decarboxylase/phosphopantothenate--cysteine ligase CoaBC [Candidatus Bathyarchaeota archaeon]